MGSLRLSASQVRSVCSPNCSPAPGLPDPFVHDETPGSGGNELQLRLRSELSQLVQLGRLAGYTGRACFPREAGTSALGSPEAREPEARLCRRRLPWAFSLRNGQASASAGRPTNAGLRYSGPLRVASSLRGRSSGAAARRSSWSIKAPHRWGSSRNGAWRPGMTSRCALGISAVARRPISGPP